MSKSLLDVIVIENACLIPTPGEPLVQRADDKPEIIAKRLSQYQSQTTPLLEYFSNEGLLRTFTGTESDKIWPEVKNFFATELLPSLSK